jgi:hypothetical protein
MEGIIRGRIDREDLYVLISHVVIGVLASMAFHSISELGIVLKTFFVLIYVVG